MKHILHLEDSPHDAAFISELIRAEWPQCDIDRVSSRATFRAALERGGYDLILSDFSLPDLKGNLALDLARTLQPDTPFVFMSGTIGEERAIEALKRGAVDYVLKDRPDRLISAIRQALRLKEETAARRRSEEALRMTQERHRLLVEHARDAIFTLSETGTITALNPAFERITGWPKEQWLGREFHDLIHADDLARARDRFERSLRGEPVGVFELRLRTAAGGVVDMEFSATPFIAGLGITGIGRDVTERKRSLARLHEQAEIIDRAPMAVFITDLAHRIIYVNRGVLQLYGLKRENVIGETGEALFTPETMRMLAPARDATLQTGSWHGEVPIQMVDGRQLFVEFFMSLIRDDAGQPRARLSVGVDVTERRKLETQLQRAARLDSIGMLAGGIAHDLNNVLAPIQMGLDLMMRGRSVDPSSLQVLEIMERSARHGADLVRQLLAFARGDEIQRIETHVGPLIEDVRDLLVRTLPRGVTIVSRSPSHLAPVLADGTQLKQVLLNLCINARDAMPDGGRISLEAATATAAEVARHAPGAVARRYVRISVTDTGTGMPPAVLEKIFDPFFTTKGRGKGTGLGLSTVRGIVEKHEGVIAVESEVGRGTSFHLFLPELPTQSRSPAAGSSDAAGLASAGQGELVLIVDGKPDGWAARAARLEQFGYRTVRAVGVGAALDWLQQHRGQARFALVDATNPETDASGFLAAVPVLDPDVRIVTLGDQPGLAGTPAAEDVRTATLRGILQRIATAG